MTGSGELRVVVSWRLFMMGFMLTILTVPSNLYKLPGTLPFDLEVYRVVALVMLAAWVSAMLIDAEVELRRTPLDLQMILLALAVWLSFLVNVPTYQPPELAAAFKAVIFFFSFLCVFYFVTSTHIKAVDIGATLKFIVIMGGFVGFFGFIERLTGYNIFRHLHQWIPFLRAGGESDVMVRGGIRVAGSLIHPIAFSAVLAMMSPLAFHYAYVAKRLSGKITYSICTGFILFALALTGSRTGFVALAVALLVMLAGLPEARRTILMGAAVLFVSVHFLFPGALGTIKTMLSPSYLAKMEIGNSEGRIEDYPKVAAEVRQRPLFGLGYDAFSPQNYFYVDNQYLKFAVELGLFGMLVLLATFGRIITKLWRSSRTAAARDKSLLVAIMASCTAFMMATATFDTFGFSQVPYLFFTIAGLGIAQVLHLEKGDLH